jgi:hypothetical protein
MNWEDLFIPSIKNMRYCDRYKKTVTPNATVALELEETKGNA